MHNHPTPKRFLAVACLLVAGIAPWAEAAEGPAAAPPPVSALVRGRVVDSAGSPVPGANLSLRREADSYLLGGRSGADGRFALEGRARPGRVGA